MISNNPKLILTIVSNKRESIDRETNKTTVPNCYEPNVCTNIYYTYVQNVYPLEILTNDLSISIIIGK